MTTTALTPINLKVFLNHIYEFKKGVRQLVLYTANRKYEASIVARLESQQIPYLLQPVGSSRINVFFGRGECIDAVSMLVGGRPLYQLSPEEDFILGALLGYDLCGQCRRYQERKQKRHA